MPYMRAINRQSAPHAGLRREKTHMHRIGSLLYKLELERMSACEGKLTRVTLAAHSFSGRQKL